MYEKLEELNRLNNAMDKIVANVNRCNKELESGYKQHEEMRLSEFMESMSELAGYAKNLSFRHFVTDIGLNDMVLIFDFDENGDFAIKKAESDVRVYVSKFAECDNTGLTWYHSTSGYFEYGWGYYYSRKTIDKHKKFIAIHANEILDAVQKMIEDRFGKEIKAKANKAYKEQSRLIVDIERVKK